MNDEMIQAYMDGWNISRERAIEILRNSGHFHMPSQEYLDQEAQV